MKDQKGGHERMALAGDPPTPGVLDFSDESVEVKPFQEAGDASNLAAGFEGVAGCGEELAAEVPVGKALEKMFPAHHGGKEAKILSRCGIEAPIGTVVMTDRFGDGVHLLMGGGGSSTTARAFQ